MLLARNGAKCSRTLPGGDVAGPVLRGDFRFSCASRSRPARLSAPLIRVSPGARRRARILEYRQSGREQRGSHRLGAKRIQHASRGPIQKGRALPVRSVMDDDSKWFKLLHDHYQHFK